MKACTSENQAYQPVTQRDAASSLVKIRTKFARCITVYVTMSQKGVFSQQSQSECFRVYLPILHDG